MDSSEVKLICFDLDLTLTEDMVWPKLNTAMGMTEDEDQMLLKFYQEGIISYAEWEKLLAKIYRKRGKANQKSIMEVISKYEYKDGAQEVVKYLKSKGYIVGIITGTMDSYAKKIAEELSMDFYSAINSIIFDEKGEFLNIYSIGDEAASKLYYLKKICEENNLEFRECACIGDGANEEDIFKVTGKGITFKGSKLESEAWKVIDNLHGLKDIF